MLKNLFSGMDFTVSELQGNLQGTNIIVLSGGGPVRIISHCDPSGPVDAVVFTTHHYPWIDVPMCFGSPVSAK